MAGWTAGVPRASNTRQRRAESSLPAVKAQASSRLIRNERGGEGVESDEAVELAVGD